MKIIAFSDLPLHSHFPEAMPRYPNLWLFVPAGFFLRPRYRTTVCRTMEVLEKRLNLRDTFLGKVENSNLRRLFNTPGEGSDFQARIGPMERYSHPADPARSHRHQIHARFYISPLIQHRRTMLDEWFLIPASVHYEVATEEPLHPYADDCPHCGIPAGVDINRNSQDYCVKIHDPLGLEALIHGTIHGRRLHTETGTPLSRLMDLGGEVFPIEASQEYGVIQGLRFTDPDLFA